MRIILKTTLLLFFANTAFGQISLQVFNYRPTGEFGFVMKPTFSAAAGYMGSFDEDHRFRPRANATFLVMKPRMATFPVYGLLEDYGEHLLPGTESFQKYNILLLSGGVDCAIIRKENYFFYAGLDITFGAASVEYTDEIETLENESYSGGGYLGGLRGRIGAEYDFNDNIGLFLDVEREGWLISDPASINWANRYGLGIKYNF